MVELILISVTLGAAILGTVSNPTRNVKAVIICLAILTSLATGFKSYSDAKESSINKKLIISLVQASNQPTYFSHDLVKQLSPLLENSKKYVSGQTVFEESGERLLVISMLDTDEIAGILYMSKQAMNPIFYAYAIDEPLEEELKKSLSDKWTNCESHWNKCINELSAISKMAFDVAPVEVFETTASFDSDTLHFELSSTETYRDNEIKIVLQREFIESLYGMNPDDRGLKILNAGQMHILQNL